TSCGGGHRQSALHIRYGGNKLHQDDASARQARIQRRQFVDALKGNPLKLLSFNEMIEEVFDRLGTSVAPTQLSRTLQMMKASGWQMQLRNIPKTTPTEESEPQP